MSNRTGPVWTPRHSTNKWLWALPSPHHWLGPTTEEEGKSLHHITSHSKPVDRIPQPMVSKAIKRSSWCIVPILAVKVQQVQLFHSLYYTPVWSPTETGPDNLFPPKFSIAAIWPHFPQKDKWKLDDNFQNGRSNDFLKKGSTIVSFKANSNSTSLEEAKIATRTHLLVTFQAALTTKDLTDWWWNWQAGGSCPQSFRATESNSVQMTLQKCFPSNSLGPAQSILSKTEWLHETPRNCSLSFLTICRHILQLSFFLIMTISIQTTERVIPEDR